MASPTGFLGTETEEAVKILGIFGDKTEVAVRGFEEALGVSIDGIVGR